MKRTKIICTIGPASESPKIMEQLIKNGMNIARLNFSHGSYENHLGLMKTIREVSSKLKTPAAILQDLQGPKIRIGKLDAPFKIKKGQTVVLGKDIPLDFDISVSVKPKERILVEDGIMELVIKSIKGSEITCTVVTDGEIRSHKGVNLPDSKITFPIFTKKDIADLQFGLQNDVDFVALSFVRGPQDINQMNKYIDKYLPKGKARPMVVAKIELGEAVENFDQILAVTDAVMVARGDLGVEVADSQVPLIQKDIIHKCNRAAKPVIVATQMLDSMIRNPRPTRAEVSDVANAVIDQADAVMLSGESAFGAYPVETVAEMSRIIEATENSPYDDSPAMPFGGKDSEDRKASLIASAVHKLSLGVSASVIIGTSESGYTARFISRERPHARIILMTDRPKVYRQMCMMWGVAPLFIDNLKSLKNVEGLLAHFVAQAKKLKLISKGQKAVLVAGHPLGQRMNLVQAVDVK